MSSSARTVNRRSVQLRDFYDPSENETATSTTKAIMRLSKAQSSLVRFVE